jgi:hypothetical protein
MAKPRERRIRLRQPLLRCHCSLILLDGSSFCGVRPGGFWGMLGQTRNRQDGSAKVGGDAKSTASGRMAIPGDVHAHQRT